MSNEGPRTSGEKRVRPYDPITNRSLWYSNRWTFDAVVHIPQGARDRVTELKATRDFASEAEAETEAVAFVKKWIDDGKVPL
jgi:hypothetical protein